MTLPSVSTEIQDSHDWGPAILLSKIETCKRCGAVRHVDEPHRIIRRDTAEFADMLCSEEIVKDVLES